MGLPTYLIVILLSGIQAIIAAVFFGTTLKRKLSLVKSCAIYSIVIVTAVLIMFERVVQPYRGLITFGLPLIMVFTLFGDSIKNKIIAYTIWMFFSSVTDPVSYYLVHWLDISDPFVNDMVMNAVFSVIYAFSLAIAHQYIKSFKGLPDKKLFIAFLFIPIIQIVTYIYFFYLQFKVGIITFDGVANKYTGDNSFPIFFIALSLITLVADYVFMRIAIKSVSGIQEKQRLELLEKESELNYEYYAELQKDAVEMRKYRHDVNNIIQTIRYMVEQPSDESREEILRIAHQLEKEINEIGLKKYTNNNLVNCILANNEKRFKNKNISCNFNVVFPETTSISELDICRLLTNIFDNAYNALAISEVQNKSIFLNIDYKDGYIYLTEENNISLSSKDVDSQKKKDSHYGLKIIKSISEKYNGFCEHKINDATFCLKISLQSIPSK